MFTVLSLLLLTGAHSATARVHIFQLMSGCEWDDETGEVKGFLQFGYDGEDFLSLDLKTETRIAPTPKSVITKLKWDQNKARLADNKNLYTEECPSFVKMFLEQGRSTLLRTVDLTSQRNQRMGKIYQVVVHGFKGEKMTIELFNTEEQMKTMTVLQMKEKIAEKLPQSGGEEALRLVFTDKMLDGDFTLLSEYGIQHQSVIQMALRVPGGETA